MSADDNDKVTPIPQWKRALQKAWEKPGGRGINADKQRANASIKRALLDAFDHLGNEAFFIRLGQGSAEDRRCLAMILSKLVPLEVQGSLDHSLTVKIVKQVGEKEIVIAGGKEANLHRPPKDARTGEYLPTVPATIDAAVMERETVDDDG